MTTKQQNWNKEIHCSTCDETFSINTENLVIVKCYIFGEFVCERYSFECPECKKFYKIDEETLPDFVKDSVLKRYGKKALQKHR